jgi:hypothetical protein
MFSILRRQNTQCGRYAHDLSNFCAVPRLGAAAPQAPKTTMLRRKSVQPTIIQFVFS